MIRQNVIASVILGRIGALAAMGDGISALHLRAKRAKSKHALNVHIGGCSRVIHYIITILGL